MFPYTLDMICLRGTPISNHEASELARRLREHADDAADVADRVDRALAIGTGLIATNRAEALAVLAVVEEWTVETPPSERLVEARSSLVELIGS